MLEFLTRAIFRPVKSTLLRALKNGNFAMWPSLAENTITKFMGKSEDSALGHMYQTHNKSISTRITEHTDAREEYVEVIPIEHQERTNYIFAVMGYTVTGIIANDQT